MNCPRCGRHTEPATEGGPYRCVYCSWVWTAPKADPFAFLANLGPPPKPVCVNRGHSIPRQPANPGGYLNDNE